MFELDVPMGIAPKVQYGNCKGLVQGRIVKVENPAGSYLIGYLTTPIQPLQNVFKHCEGR